MPPLAEENRPAILGSGFEPVVVAALDSVPGLRNGRVRLSIQRFIMSSAIPRSRALFLATLRILTTMRQRSQDCVEHKIEILADVFGQKPQHEIAVFLQ